MTFICFFNNLYFTLCRHCAMHQVETITWKNNRVCVMCGSSVGRDPAYALAAQCLGRMLAQRGLGIVYGGAGVGLMGALADAACEAGGEVIGVITPDLADLVGHESVRLERVETIHQRKERFAALCDAYIAMPGGFGTLEELFEAVTWNQLGIHDKPGGAVECRRLFRQASEVSPPRSGGGVRAP